MYVWIHFSSFKLESIVEKKSIIDQPKAMRAKSYLSWNLQLIPNKRKNKKFNNYSRKSTTKISLINHAVHTMNWLFQFQAAKQFMNRRWDQGIG